MFKGSSSVLIKCGKVNVLLCRAQTDSLSIALNSLFIFSCFKIFVAFVLGCLGSIKRVLKWEETTVKYLSILRNRFRSQWLNKLREEKGECRMAIYNASLFIYISSWDSFSSRIAKPKGLYIFNFKNTQTFLEKG